MFAAAGGMTNDCGVEVDMGVLLCCAVDECAWYGATTFLNHA
jgi:hypothetical protein